MGSSSNRKRWIGFLLVLLVWLGSISTPFQSFASFPQELRLFPGQNRQIALSVPVSASVSVSDPAVLKVNGSNRPTFQLNLKHPITLQSEQAGQTEMRLKLFGKIPFKTVKVRVVPDLKVIPGGQTIGVKLKSSGVLVVGHHLVSVAPNRKVSPGEEAKLRVGDLIVSINGASINDVSKVSDLVAKSGEAKRPLELIVKRQQEQIKISLNPAYDVMDKAYRLGLYIRDSAAGVGTLTFYAPDQGVYGALGHVITDMDTQTPIEVGAGEITHSNVTSIAKSQTGEPGEKRAHLDNKVLGNIERNTAFGIFGKMFHTPDHGIETEPIPVAFSEEVKEGPAKIYTVLSGQKVEKFDIEITHVAKQDVPATKGLVIKITDPRLLEKTGGIVQGMSGSPIIQDGKMVGAVTHVFVNDPSSGYGCFIEWMLRDAGISLEETDQQQTLAS
ncbi:SpoIVB peptidase [Paenibacillus sp. J31TS4]|uniref:SpoIVB peptidase n=1 Tax=Paenibacillus sp. J31TS4 TaxID=2807195 RepID=UPI001AFF9ECA|nr:SpoIVB peptidase [Paenibacillus sp. J31TS4]GIP37591.1 SpoIVB peptidase [Paenibacillus sp. J31TS4]